MSLDSTSSFPMLPPPRIVPAERAPAPAAPASSAPPVQDVVSISDGAQAALAVGDALRERLNDPAVGRAGLPSFSDDELARIALNRDGTFSDDAMAGARGALGDRLAISLAPHDAAFEGGDPRGRAMAINALHARMSDDMRAALDWTPAVMKANNTTLRDASTRSGWLDNRRVAAGLDQAAREGGLDFSGMNFNWLDSYPDPPWLDYPFNDGVSRFSSDRTNRLAGYQAGTERLA